MRGRRPPTPRPSPPRSCGTARARAPAARTRHHPGAPRRGHRGPSGAPPRTASPRHRTSARPRGHRMAPRRWRRYPSPGPPVASSSAAGMSVTWGARPGRSPGSTELRTPRSVAHARLALLGEGQRALRPGRDGPTSTPAPRAPALQASVSPCSSAPHSARFVAAMAAGELRAIFSASACASSRRRSGGSTIWLIMPSSSARSADMRSCRPTRAMRITASTGIRRARPISSIGRHLSDRHVGVEELRRRTPRSRCRRRRPSGTRRRRRCR